MILQRITNASPHLHNASVHTGPYTNRDPRDIIRTLAKTRGFTSDRALALAAGLKQPTLSRYLAGTSQTMEVAQFQALAHTLEVTLSELLGEVPLSSGGRLHELSRLMDQLPEPQQRALLAAAKAMADPDGHA
jgi:transcriptional regulator with XRE-family HTH domain